MQVYLLRARAPDSRYSVIEERTFVLNRRPQPRIGDKPSNMDVNATPLIVSVSINELDSDCVHTATGSV